MRIRFLGRRRAVEDGLKVDLRVLEVARLHLRDSSVVSRFDERGVEAERVRNVRIPRRARARPEENLDGLVRAAFPQHGKSAPIVDEVGKVGVLFRRRRSASAPRETGRKHEKLRRGDAGGPDAPRPHAEAFSGTSSPRNSKSPEFHALSSAAITAGSNDFPAKEMIWVMT